MRSQADVMLTHAPREYKLRVEHQLKWVRTQHHYQILPRGDWLGWMLLAGRGSGKTRAGAEDCARYITSHRRVRYAIVAPTIGDARDICIEGESGVKDVLDDMGLIEDTDYTWNRSMGELKITSTDSYVKIFGSLKPNRLRGPQWHRAWLEELAAWDDAHRGDQLQTCYNNLMLGLRLGHDPRYIVTTTPKPVTLVRELVARSDVVLTRGTSYDNLSNLAPKYHEIIEKYEGTRVGRQEIMGVLLDDVEGALWTQALIDDYRWETGWGVPRMREVFVGADPSGSATAGETGIIAAGTVRGKCPCGARETQQHYVVLRDCSKKGTAMERARAIVACFDNAAADKVVGERNYGGDNVQALVAEATEGSDRVPYEHVNATRGKEIRAEPVSSAYEQGRVHHVDVFVKLEEQLTTWEPDAGWSPDRLDALVWAVTKLQQRKRRKVRTGGQSTARLPERIG